MKQLFTITLCLLSLGVMAKTLTLQQCIDSALLNNLTVQKQANQYASQRLQYTQSKADISPSINGSAGQSWIFGRSIGVDNIYHAQNSSQTTFNLSANIVLFDGLQMINIVCSDRTTEYPTLSCRTAYRGRYVCFRLGIL